MITTSSVQIRKPGASTPPSEFGPCHAFALRRASLVTTFGTTQVCPWPLKVTPIIAGRIARERERYVDGEGWIVLPCDRFRIEPVAWPANSSYVAADLYLATNHADAIEMPDPRRVPEGPAAVGVKPPDLSRPPLVGLVDPTGLVRLARGDQSGNLLTMPASHSGAVVVDQTTATDVAVEYAIANLEGADVLQLIIDATGGNARAIEVRTAAGSIVDELSGWAPPGRAFVRRIVGPLKGDLTLRIGAGDPGCHVLALAYQGV